MYRDNSVGAVILAAGESNRMNGRINKVYREIRGEPVLSYSIKTFLNSGTVDDIVLVFNEEDRSLMEERILNEFQPDGTVKLVPGGEKRQDSSWAGLKALDTDYVFIHDGARPNFSTGLVSDLLQATLEQKAAFPGVKPVDTIREIDGKLAGKTVDRDKLVKVQTPQCFKRSLLGEALEDASEEGSYFTDDAGAVMALGGVEPIIVSGEKGNVKLTTDKDMKLIKFLLES